jgi:hypothetical protein
MEAAKIGIQLAHSIVIRAIVYEDDQILTITSENKLQMTAHHPNKI